jgi:hypothetical protein
MPRSPRPRKTGSLSDSLHKRLNMYALAAGTAGLPVRLIFNSTTAPSFTRIRSRTCRHQEIVSNIP